MVLFKRNQVEEALSRVLGERSQEPSKELRTRIKRLLETDRALGRKPRSPDPALANYAFFSSEPPGRGADVLFSAYEAFAVLTGLRLMQHGWPQSFPVTILRRLRPHLEAQHSRILRQDRDALFGFESIRAKARPGDLAFDNSDPVLLVVVSGDAGEDEFPRCAVCRGMEEVTRFVKRENVRSWTLHELVTPAWALSDQLEKSQPRKRGRSS